MRRAFLHTSIALVTCASLSVLYSTLQIDIGLPQTFPYQNKTSVVAVKLQRVDVGDILPHRFQPEVALTVNLTIWFIP